MEERTLRVLEYPKIIAMLEERASSSLGKERVRELRPSDDPVLIREWLKETSECRAMRSMGEQLPLGGLHDIRQAVKRAEVGGTLQEQVLLQVADTLRASRQVSAFFAPRREKYPLLSDWAGGLGDFRDIERAIESAIGPGGEVLDSASPLLGRIRAQIRTLQNRLKDKLDSMVRSPEIQKHLQDTIVTLRNDRYVLPVRQEHKGMVPGIIHDQSSSGATLFIEPMAIVEFNNQLRQYELQQEEEIHRILAELSARVGDRAIEIRVSVDILAHLDFVNARAKLADEQNAVEPLIEDDSRVVLVGARHPLLKGQVVPIDLELGRNFDTLVITGPNTGGKTVTLKTVGLLTLMAQSGLHVPARHGTGFGVFRQIFSDIGDEQSIEQSLSTFSSHMTHIVDILARARNGDSLVLLDELGAGTDPTEGAALAMAILDHLHASGVRTVATTHYAELKTYAYSQSGIENASVEFDVETLRPTYRLILGTPGRSNAFEIAMRLGLSPSLVQQARALLSSEHQTMEELISNIQNDEKEARRHRQEADQLRLRYDRLLQEVTSHKNRLESEKQHQLKQAREQAREIVERARRETEELIRQLRSEAEQNRLEEAARNARNDLRARKETLDHELQPVKRQTSVQALKGLKPGENVSAVNLGRQGIVLEVNSETAEAVVQIGIMKVTLALNELERVKPAPDTRRPAAGGLANLEHGKAQTMSIELDLRGMTADEAIEAVDKYLDDAILAGLPRARIIHGKGTGALRNAIIAYLRDHARVKAYRMGESGEGGAGVTVVEIS